MEILDDFDTRILAMLEGDGRIAFSSIAAELGISNTMVHQRVNKMMDNGIITGIKPVLDEKKLGYDWGAFTGITLEKDGDAERVIEALKAIPEIMECYYVSGSYTLYLRVIARNHEDMRRLLYGKIDCIAGIAKTESIMDLGCAFRRNVVV